MYNLEDSQQQEFIDLGIQHPSFRLAAVEGSVARPARSSTTEFNGQGNCATIRIDYIVHGKLIYAFLLNFKHRKTFAAKYRNVEGGVCNTVFNLLLP